MFIATLVYDLAPDTAPAVRKLVRAELAGRRWQSKADGLLLPANCVWSEKSTKPGESTKDLHRQCLAELNDALQAVTARGHEARLLRAWAHVSGAGTYGPMRPPNDEQ